MNRLHYSQAKKTQNSITEIMERKYQERQDKRLVAQTERRRELREKWS